MASKGSKPRLSKHILEMKFMQRTKAKVCKELEEEEGRQMYSSEITDKMLHNNTNIIIEPSIVNCENLIEGRLSFRGMNPEIERLLELEQAERAVKTRHNQLKEVSDGDMMSFYKKQMRPAANTVQKKFQKNQTNKKRKWNNCNEVTDSPGDKKKAKITKFENDNSKKDSS